MFYGHVSALPLPVMVGERAHAFQCVYVNWCLSVSSSVATEFTMEWWPENIRPCVPRILNSGNTAFGNTDEPYGPSISWYLCKGRPLAYGLCMCDRTRLGDVRPVLDLSHATCFATLSDGPERIKASPRGVIALVRNSGETLQRHQPERSMSGRVFQYGQRAQVRITTQHIELNRL
jgi:hypothetical protein